MLVREIEKDMLPTARRHGMGVIPWSPLAGGWLSGRYRKGQEIPKSTRAERIPGRYDLSTPENQRKLDAADALGQLADEAGITLIEMAIAFVIRHPAVTSAIIGPRTMEHLESQLTAADVVLSDDVLDRIDEIVRTGRQHQPGRRRLAEPGPRARGAAPLAPGRGPKPDVDSVVFGHARREAAAPDGQPARRSQSAVSRSAGKNASTDSSETVTSTAVPNVVTVEKNVSGGPSAPAASRSATISASPLGSCGAGSPG